jgi:hypothetical protein
MKPNFQEISLDELRNYVLQHREDAEAFHTLIDRRKAANPDRITYPYPNTPETMAITQRAIRDRLGQ